MSVKYMFEAFKLKVGNPIRKLILLKLADNADDDGFCFPSQATLAEASECSRKTVNTHCRQLEEDGYIKIVGRTRENGSITSNGYQLIYCSAENPAVTNLHTPCENFTQPPASPHVKDLHNHNQSYSNLPDYPGNTPHDFTVNVIRIIEEKASRKFSADGRWLQRFKNDILSLLHELSGDHERIMKVMEWYRTADCMITVDSGFSLKDKFSRIERLMNSSRDETDDKREKICDRPGIVKANRKQPWECSCGQFNSAIDDNCMRCQHERITE